MMESNNILADVTSENDNCFDEDDSGANLETRCDDILPGFKSMEDFVQSGFRAAMELTKMANALPSGHNWDLYTSYSSFPKIMEGEGNLMLQAISMVLQHQGVSANILRRDLEEKFDLIVDANDAILERVSCNLDELAGVRRNLEPVLVEAAVTRPVSVRWDGTRQSEVGSNTQPNGQTVRLLSARNVERPQAKFSHKVDNTTAPFEPIIKDKPNSLKPLAIMLEITEDGERFNHPYEVELDRFHPPAEQLQKVVNPTQPPPISDTPLAIVEDVASVSALLDELRHCSEVAVDLEHHSYRSYQGLTCLMQLSTRTTDYIIDTLALRSHLQPLNEIFTNPKIVKVFHGADLDVEWLQRDLGLYVVNMFDTHQAARALGAARLSLAFLLQHYCGVVADKRYQLADWRIRPLPEELVKYAREDTHYLLYIYDCMKNELLEASNGNTNLLLSVITRSTEICKKRYEKPVITEDSHLELYHRHKKLFDNRQMYALREIFNWRDKTARQEDESVGYVLPNHMMLQMAELLPREMQGILACCNPIPPLVRQNLNALHQMVLRAREQPLVRPVMEEERRSRPAAMARVAWDDPLICPHDLAHGGDVRDDLPCLLNGCTDINTLPPSCQAISASEPQLTVFADGNSLEEEDNVQEMPARAQQLHFLSPYARYCRVRPYAQQLELDSMEETISTSIKTDEDDIKDELGPVLELVPTIKEEVSDDTISSSKLSVSVKEEVSSVIETATGNSPVPQLPLKNDTSTEVTLSNTKTLLVSGLDKKEHHGNNASDANASVELVTDIQQDSSDDKKVMPSRKRKHQPQPTENPVLNVENVAGLTVKKSKRRKKPKNKKAVVNPDSDKNGSSNLGQDGQNPRHQKRPQTSREHEQENTPTPPKVPKKNWDQQNLRWSQGKGANTPTRGRIATSTPSGSTNTEPFQPFDYSSVDYESRFKGGSRQPSRGSAHMRGAKGKRGKTRFAGKVNQKSMTFAKKLI